MKKIALILMLALVMTFCLGIVPAFAGGGPGLIATGTAYTMIPVQNDSFMTIFKTVGWLNANNGVYGYVEGFQAASAVDISIASSIGTITVCCPKAVVKVIWSTKAPLVPTVTFTKDTQDRIITSAVITAHETVTYKSKRVTYWRHHHKHHKTVKVKVVTHDAKFWAMIPDTSGQPLG